MMTLSEVKKGQRLWIKKVNAEDIRPQAMRLGLYEGADLECTEAIKNGPVVLRNAFCEIAVGQKIAKNILVTVA